MINRYGLNSKGADHMAEVLRQRVRAYAAANGFGYHDAAEDRVLNGEAGVPPGSLTEGKLLAVQVAKNKLTPESDIAAVTNDYVYCVDRLAPYADIMVVNVSSPNTPGLRGLQAAGPLTEILKGVVGAAKRIDRKTKPFVMVKVSPDEDSEEQVDGICHAIRESGVDGVIVGNTTNRRPSPLPKGYVLPEKEVQTLTQTGGYSGPQLFERTVALVSRYKEKLNNGESPKTIFASGGITNGKQAQAVLDAGASVAMMYTAITYGGTGTVTRVKNELRKERNV
jgi:dihydroorotate dehydrogenase